MESDFNQSLKFVLVSEGGNDDDPHDHGGRTSRGITQREYDAYCQTHNLPGGDVWKAPQDAIDAIYRESYWNPYCDSFPVGIDYGFFDFAVNAGTHRAVVFTQRTLVVPADGTIGPVTRAALAKADPSSFTVHFTAIKAAWYRSIAIGDQRRYLNGWLHRDLDAQRNALNMIRGISAIAERTPGAAYGLTRVRIVAGESP